MSDESGYDSDGNCMFECGLNPHEAVVGEEENDRRVRENRLIGNF